MSEVRRDAGKSTRVRDWVRWLGETRVGWGWDDGVGPGGMIKSEWMHQTAGRQHVLPQQRVDQSALTTPYHHKFRNRFVFKFSFDLRISTQSSQFKLLPTPPEMPTVVPEQDHHLFRTVGWCAGELDRVAQRIPLAHARERPVGGEGGLSLAGAPV